MVVILLRILLFPGLLGAAADALGDLENACVARKMNAFDVEG